ncbi:hypothetical protein LCGC14_2696570, partial [marine sediment metagenome]
SGWTWNVAQGDVPGPALRLDVNSLLAGNNDAVHIESDSNGVRITGKTPIALRHGAYIFLEKLGCRWFFKSSVWDVIPGYLVEIGDFDEVHEPEYIWRRIWHPSSVGGGTFKIWKIRNRLGGEAFYDVQHSYDGIISKSEYAAHPEWFLPEGEAPKQLRCDHPEVIARAIEYARNKFNAAPRSDWDSADVIPRGSVPISPNDGTGWNPPWSDGQVITDKVFGLCNEVARVVATEYPGRYVGVYSYSAYSSIPSIDLEPNILAQIATEFNQSGLNIKQRIEGMAAKGIALGIRDYYDVNVWYRDKPPTNFYELLQMIPWYSDRGVTSYNAESGDGWGARGLLYYAASHLYWEPHASLDGILDDFYDKAFGPANWVMKKYYERWFSGMAVSDLSLGLAFQDMAEAEALAAGNEPVLERIRHIEYYLRYLWIWKKRGAND